MIIIHPPKSDKYEDRFMDFLNSGGPEIFKIFLFFYPLKLTFFVKKIQDCANLGEKNAIFYPIKSMNLEATFTDLWDSGR